MNNINEKIKELTIILMYLTSWEESEIGYKYRRSWKGYDFDILNELSDEGLINDGKRSKSITFNESGVNLAKELLEKYDISI